MSALFRYRLFGLLACAFLSLPDSASAAKIPLDEKGFTSALAKAFRKAMPGFHVTIRGPLALIIVGPDDDPHQSALDTVYGVCQRNPDGCEAAVDGHVA